MFLALSCSFSTTHTPFPAQFPPNKSCSFSSSRAPHQQHPRTPPEHEQTVASPAPTSPASTEAAALRPLLFASSGCHSTEKQQQEGSIRPHGSGSVRSGLHSQDSGSKIVRLLDQLAPHLGSNLAMELATGAMGSLLPKLLELLKEEYQLQTGVKKDVKFLESEMRSMDTALRKVARVPRDQLDEQVKIWADEVRELSYQMEDVVDSFLVRVEGSEPAVDPDTFKGLMKKVANLFKKGKTRHQIADAIKDIKGQVQEVAARRDRYKVDDVRANPAAATTVDPRMLALFKEQRELIGIEGPREELIKRLTCGDDGVSTQQLKILSIFGFGGLGKTTLAKAVYDKLQGEFICRAFVPVGQNPSPKKVLMDILRQLDKDSYLNATMLDERQLIEELRGLLENKRYLIVIDDIWDESSWEIIRCAWIDCNCGSRIITTTRIFEVAKVAGDVYKQEPLSPSRSKELFYTRLSIGKCKTSYDHSVEMSEKILQKCGGVPLAIITIASLLASKPREDWSEVYDSIGFGYGDNKQVDNTRKILLYSYYDLPYYLRTCLLHLSIFPEDYQIWKDKLIWKWVAEGFIQEKPGMGLFELGERYFNELINRSMIQPIEEPYKCIVYACRVHDLVLDMIYSLSKEENFVVVLGSNEQHTCPQSNARRLAVQKRGIDQDDPMANTPLPQVRSFYATMCHFKMMPSLLNFQCLRVLALEGCIFTEDRPYHLEHLGRLLQLRYLELSDMPITELPLEIGSLRFLQVLDLSSTNIEELPRSVGLLRQLKCLNLPYGFTGVLDWIGNLTSLEELLLPNVSPNFVKELGKLTELRNFWITSEVTCGAKLFNDLMESLCSLQKLQFIVARFEQPLCIERASCEGYVPHGHLRWLWLSEVVFARLPSWMDSSRLPRLSHLSLGVGAVEAQDVEILGRFPELVWLRLGVGARVDVFPDIMGGGAFPKLRRFKLICTTTVWVPRFLQGAMPSLEYFGYSIRPLASKTANSSSFGDFASIGNLPCLQKIKFKYASELELEEERKSALEAEAALRHAIEAHPNRPTLEVKT